MVRYGAKSQITIIFCIFNRCFFLNRLIVLLLLHDCIIVFLMNTVGLPSLHQICSNLQIQHYHWTTTPHLLVLKGLWPTCHKNYTHQFSHLVPHIPFQSSDYESGIDFCLCISQKSFAKIFHLTSISFL